MSQDSTTNDAPVQSEDTKRRFRNAVGRFATGVTVLTTVVDGELHGMTANSFSSLSLDPMLVLACIDNAGTSAGFFEQCEHFVVNMLAADQADVSGHFASRKRYEDPMGSHAHRVNAHGVPVLDNVLAYVACSVHQRVVAGDHTILIGAVLDVNVPRFDDPPLLFFGGQYRFLTDSGSAMAPDLFAAWGDV